MADHQQFLRSIPVDPDLQRVLEATKDKPVSEEELREQRVSFAFGNAPRSSEGRITKKSYPLGVATHKAAAVRADRPRIRSAPPSSLRMEKFQEVAGEPICRRMC
jgi:hypothetical protein